MRALQPPERHWAGARPKPTCRALMHDSAEVLADGLVVGYRFRVALFSVR